LAPWAITPLLMIGGAYLCFEGAEKVYEFVRPHHAHDEAGAASVVSAQAFEEQKIAGAIRTDFILSAEIMAITLSTVTDSPFWVQALVLAVVGIGLTALVYGGVALIVKADDAGVAMAAQDRPASTLLSFRFDGSSAPDGRRPRPAAPDAGVRARARGGDARVSPPPQPRRNRGHDLGRRRASSSTGWRSTASGRSGTRSTTLAEAAGHALPAVGGLLEWLVTAALSGVVGLVVGAALIPVAEHVIAPVARRFRSAGEAGATGAAH
jgi:hypothetical protein